MQINEKDEINEEEIKAKKSKNIWTFIFLVITGVLIFALTRYTNNEFIIYTSRILWYIHAICVSASLFFPKGDKKAMYELYKREYILLGVKSIMLFSFTLIALYFMLMFPGSITLETAIYAYTVVSWNNIFRSIDRIKSNMK